MLSSGVLSILIGALFSYLIVFLIFRKKELARKESANALMNAALFMILGIKLSLLITHYDSIVKEYTALLYLWGSSMNVAVGVMAGLGYLLWFIYKKVSVKELWLKVVLVQLLAFLLAWNISDTLITKYGTPEYVVEKPAFEKLFTLSGKKYKLVTSPIYVVNFWATWCPPCRAEMPELDVFALNHPEVEILAVNYTPSEKQGIEGVKAFIDAKGYRFDVLLDLEGELNKLYEIESFPTTLIFNSEGRIIKKHVGPISRSMLESFMDN